MSLDFAEKTARLNEYYLELIDAYWRAANYLSVGQIYLLDNPLLPEPLRPEHVKPWSPVTGHHTGTNPRVRPHEPGDQAS